ncbi:hypothetical protein PPTG_01238 [Phytophthora nicotianae INRA-310]|uniref:Uncharacterized protein n=1 Tax=Phytophthora nicotianae (strain INRA-310) TaxID=761204 RepID=W2R8M4_PHYN3|nr:hypothetical protein PPTG_01238 [Phytophthora nicotianae INRA-310]ETN20860.1 hypothetical protein PPTG_01238 [Phytophthora nicotianae INRA-310]
MAAVVEKLTADNMAEFLPASGAYSSIELVIGRILRSLCELSYEMRVSEAGELTTYHKKLLMGIRSAHV